MCIKLFSLKLLCCFKIHEYSETTVYFLNKYIKNGDFINLINYGPKMVLKYKIKRFIYLFNFYIKNRKVPLKVAYVLETSSPYGFTYKEKKVLTKYFLSQNKEVPAHMDYR